MSDYDCIDTAVLEVPCGHGFVYVTRVSACSLYSLARIAGDIRSANFWQTAMLMDEVAFWVS